MQPRPILLILVGVLLSNLTLAAVLASPEDSPNATTIADMRVGPAVSSHTATTFSTDTYYPPIPVPTTTTTPKSKAPHNPSASHPDSLTTTTLDNNELELRGRNTHGTECENGSDVAMCYISGRCQNSIICACCPFGHHDHFGEDCFGRLSLPSLSPPSPISLLPLFCSPMLSKYSC
jgi:hypothetical protein